MYSFDGIWCAGVWCAGCWLCWCAGCLREIYEGLDSVPINRLSLAWELVKVSQSVGSSSSSNSGTKFGGFTAYPLAPRLCTSVPDITKQVPYQYRYYLTYDTWPRIQDITYRLQHHSYLPRVLHLGQVWYPGLVRSRLHTAVPQCCKTSPVGKLYFFFDSRFPSFDIPI